MDPRRDRIPGLRRPSDAEMEKIAHYWLPLLRSQWFPRAGKVPRFLGRMFFCAGGVLMLKLPSTALEMGFFFLLGGIFLFISGIGRSGARKIKRMIDALETGNYMVCDATAVKFEGTFYGNSRSVIAQMELPGGESVQGRYRIPPACADEFADDFYKRVPALMIVVDTQAEILGIV